MQSVSEKTVICEKKPVNEKNSLERMNFDKANLCIQSVGLQNTSIALFCHARRDL